MQFRRLAILVLALSMLAAIAWFVRRDAQTAAVPLAPASRTLESAAPPSMLEECAPIAQETRAPEGSSDEVHEIPDAAFAPIASTEDAEGGLLVRVLDPSGAPLGHARLEAVLHTGDTQSVFVPNPVDSAGCRRFQLGASSTIDLRASDREGRWAPAFALGVSGATREVVLQLEAGLRRTLEVVDTSGAPVERFAWRSLDEREYLVHSEGRILFDENGRVRSTWLGTKAPGSFDPQPVQFVDHAGGRVEFVAGTRPLVLQVEAEGYQQAQLGPWLASESTQPLRIVLQRAPGIRGRVVHDGQGVPHAFVRLLELARPGRVTLLDGFPSRFEYPAVASATCSTDGTYWLPLRKAGAYVVQGWADQGCPTESDVLHVTPGTGANGLELALPTPGEIHGSLLLPPGASPRAWIIGASQCNALHESVHPNEEGRFQILRASPGSWLLRSCAQDVPACGVATVGYIEDPRAQPLAFTCVVRPGESTQVVIDLRQPAHLAGEVRFGQARMDELHGWLAPSGSTFSRSASFQSASPAGFQSSVDQAGDYLLRLQLPRDGGTLWIEERIHLESGENTWTFERPVGELLLVNKCEAKVQAVLRCELAGTRRVLLTADLAPLEERRLSGIPVGSWTRSQDGGGEDPGAGSIEVTVAGLARIEVR